MFEVGQQVTVITDKGLAYEGRVLASATAGDGTKAYKVAIEGSGLNQLGQWHKASEVFTLDPQAVPRSEAPIYMRSFGRS